MWLRGSKSSDARGPPHVIKEQTHRHSERSLYWEPIKCHLLSNQKYLTSHLFSVQLEEWGEVDAPAEPKDKVQDLKNQVDGVKNIMTQNVDRILARGERLDDLMDKSEDLQAGVSLDLVQFRCK